MNTYAKLAERLGVKQITDNFVSGVDLEIGEWQTADGYAIHVITQDPRNIDFEYDVFYYEPSFLTIIQRIEELGDEYATVFVSDLETYLPIYEVEDYLESTDENNNEV